MHLLPSFFFGPMSKQKLRPWPICQKGGPLYSGARYGAFWASCFTPALIRCRRYFCHMPYMYIQQMRRRLKKVCRAPLHWTRRGYLNSTRDKNPLPCYGFPTNDQQMIIHQAFSLDHSGDAEFFFYFPCTCTCISVPEYKGVSHKFRSQYVTYITLRNTNKVMWIRFHLGQHATAGV